MKIFSGSKNITLAQQTAKSLGLPLSSAEIIRFENSEVRIRIEEEVKDEVCIVIQPTSNPTDTSFMELFFFCDALKREEARKVVGVIPYFGYARQDLQYRQGECVSANVIIRFLEAVGFDKIYTIDLHNEGTAGAFSIPFKNISATPLLAQRLKKHLTEHVAQEISPQNIAILVPDQGAIEQGRLFGEEFFNTKDFPLAVVEKWRDLHHHNSVTSHGLYGDIDEKIIIIVDDMVVSGSTLISATEYLLNNHKPKEIYVAVTHHDLTDDAVNELSESKIEKIFTTNTTTTHRHKSFNKLIEVSVGECIAQELK